ncbi:hypothetical protein [Flavobacterium sp. T12S277]|uniref:hypothetical protein n=1 Tax=Flavobacterium sp. T12S277 TaxID=3402752 RepID=UPI003AEEC08D
MKNSFEIVNLPIPCAFQLQDGSRFDLRTGIPNNAYQVFKNGFEHLGLKPGAEKLFKKESESTIVKLIRKAKRIEDVEILVLVKPDNVVIQEEAKKKFEQFNRLK